VFWRIPLVAYQEEAEEVVGEEVRDICLPEPGSAAIPDGPRNERLAVPTVHPRDGKASGKGDPAGVGKGWLSLLPGASEGTVH
jgi:hypothetical protein